MKCMLNNINVCSNITNFLRKSWIEFKVLKPLHSYKSRENTEDVLINILIKCNNIVIWILENIPLLTEQ